MATYLSLSLLTPLQSIANNTAQCLATNTTQTFTFNDNKAEALIERLSEIKEMDKSALTHSEKRELRQEVRGIKTELNENHNGVYISVGGAILIVLLLILIL